MKMISKCSKGGGLMNYGIIKLHEMLKNNETTVEELVNDSLKKHMNYKKNVMLLLQLWMITKLKLMITS